MATSLRLPRYLTDVPPRRGFVWVLPRTSERIEEVRRRLRERRARGWQFDGVTATEISSVIERSCGVMVWSGEYRLEALQSAYYELVWSSFGATYRPPTHEDNFVLNRYDTLVFVPLSTGRYRMPVIAWVINRYA